MTSLDGFLGSMLGVPALPGAKCRGRSQLFDEQAKTEPHDVVEQRHAQAKLLCTVCPAFDPCRRWLESLTPAKRPTGVVAGRVVARPKKRVTK